MYHFDMEVSKDMIVPPVIAPSHRPSHWWTIDYSIETTKGDLEIPQCQKPH